MNQITNNSTFAHSIGESLRGDSAFTEDWDGWFVF